MLTIPPKGRHPIQLWQLLNISNHYHHSTPMAILEKLLLALKGFDAIATELKNDNVFQRDLGVFASACKGGIDLEAFALGSNRTVKELKDHFSLESVYIPMRASQLKPTFGFNAQHPDAHLYEENPYGRVMIKDVDFYGLLKLVDENEHFKSVLIQGNAGAGKSTFMKYLTLSFYGEEDVTLKRLIADKKGKINLHRVPFKPCYVPVLIRLRELEEAIKAVGNRTWVSSFHLSDFLSYKYGLSFESDFYTDLFRKTPVMVLFDGIDEVPEHKKLGNLDISQAKAQEWIIRQKKQLIENNSLARVILTSRPNKTEKLWREFEVFEIQDLDEVEIGHFARNWYTEYDRQLRLDFHTYIQHKQKIQAKINRLDTNQEEFLYKVNQDPLAKIITNPLLLSLSLIMHAIENQLSAGSIKELYRNFINALLYKWDEVRSMNFYPELLGSSNWDNLFTLLYRIAYQFSIQDTRQLKAGKIIDCLKENIPKLNPGIQPGQLKDLCRELLEKFRDRAGLLTGQSIDGADFEDTLFEFQHQTFQEYLTALAIHEEDWLKDSQLPEKVNNPQWKETLEFFLQLGPSKRFFNQFTASVANKKQYSSQVHYITHYWLSTPQKYFHDQWQSDLEAWLLELFLTSKDLEQSRKAYASLAQIPQPDLSKVVVFVEKFANGDVLEALRFGLAVNLLQHQGQWITIRELIPFKIKLLAKGEDHYLLPLSLVQTAAFWEGDRGLILLFDQEAKNSFKAKTVTPGVGGYLLTTEYLRTLRVMRNLPALRSWNDLKGLQALRSWKAMRDWLDLLDLLTWRSLLDLLDLLDLRDSRDLQSLLDLRNWLDLRSLRSLRSWQAFSVEELQNLTTVNVKKIEHIIDAQIAHMESLKSK